jgi:hypothetical protein
MDALRFIVKFADDSKEGRVVDTKEDQEMLDRLETWSRALWEEEWQAGVYHGRTHTRVK